MKEIGRVFRASLVFRFTNTEKIEMTKILRRELLIADIRRDHYAVVERVANLG